MAAHKHAEVIRAWADGAKIQFNNDVSNGWKDVQGQPTWDEMNEYRIKPAEQERIYPVTQMQYQDAYKIYWDYEGDSVDSAICLANAALRHAIDAGQVVTREEYDKLAAAAKAASVEGARACDLAEHIVDERYARDSAVAKAVRDAARGKFTLSAIVHPTQAYGWISNLDLDAIIATIPHK